MSVTAIASRRSSRAVDDRALARRAARGDEAAFAELYDRHAAGLLGFAQQYVGDRAAAEDIVQQTYLAAFRTLQEGTAIEHPRAWLYRVARNNALTLVRDRPPTAFGSPLEEDLLDRAAAVPAQIEQREALEEVVRDIVALPAQQRAALALFEVGDHSQAEVAEILDCTPAQVKALVFQARSSLVSRREARSASCASVRETLLAARGGALNRRLIRHHLRQCAPCTAFRDDLRDGRRRVALLLPVLPAAALREAVLGGVGGPAAQASAAATAVAARPRNPWWIAGGTAAAVGAVGLATLAWPGTPQRRPDQPAPRAAVAATPAAPPRLGGPTAKAPARRATSAGAGRRHARRAGGAKAARAAVRTAPRPAARPPASGPATTPAPPAARPPHAGPPGPRAAPRRPAPATPKPREPQAPARATPPAAGPPAGGPPAAAAPPPAAPPSAAPAPTPAAPAPAPPASPSPACTDHSHASPQGLAHGRGHDKC